MTVDLSVAIGSLKLKNPVMPASGTFGAVQEFAPFYDPALLGAVVPKTVTLEPRDGNPQQRAVETAAGMLNAIGLQNPGFEVFAAEYWPYIRELDTVRILNISGWSSKDYIALAQKAGSLEGVDAIELNVSCPNVHTDGKIFGTDPQRVAELVAAVKQVLAVPLITKLSPNVTDITAIASAAAEAGSDALTVANTFLGMAINADTCRPVIANVRAGLSGPAIKPLALRMVYDVSAAVDIPVIGVGGIASGRDAAEFMMAGAAAVQVGTGNFVDPAAGKRIIDELAAFLEQKGYASAAEIIGSARV